MTDEQYDDIMRVCEFYPHVEMFIQSEVYDDEDAHTITAGAIVTLTITLKRQNLRVLFDKETPVVDDKAAAADEYKNGETNGEATNGEVTKVEEVAKPKAATKPWEKQKKKPKYAKAKPKSKAKVNTKVINNTSTNKKAEGTVAAADTNNKSEEVEVIVIR